MTRRTRRLYRKINGVASYSLFEERGPGRDRYDQGRVHLGLPHYLQLDQHSCGFLAALSVVRYFHPQRTLEEVLLAVKPGEWGTTESQLIRGLKKCGVAARLRKRLSPRKLFLTLAAGLPAIVTVWLDGAECTHWTTARGFDWKKERIYLTNYADRGLSLSDFHDVWFPRGEALICRKLE